MMINAPDSFGPTRPITPPRDMFRSSALTATRFPNRGVNPFVTIADGDPDVFLIVMSLLLFNHIANPSLHLLQRKRARTRHRTYD
jgi:hypothetical protein